MKYYALVVEGEVRLIIPWNEDRIPAPLEFCQAISAVWAKSGADFSFGIVPEVKEFHHNPVSMEG